MSVGLKIVYAEHHRLAAVLSCLQNVSVAEVEDIHDATLDTVDALLSYVEEFVYRYHHPKEDQYLFPAIGKRCPHTLGVIAELEQQHSDGTVHIAELRELLNSSRNDATTIPQLLDKLKSYTEFESQHMVLENTKVFAVAKDCLKEEDWKEIDAAFTNHDDPVFGDKQSNQLRQRFTDIVMNAPAPYGLADSDMEIEAEHHNHRSVWQQLKHLFTS
ncbi:MAG: hemerythrin domain-containing protein [Chromatiales bacterium]|nr:hemerythrin domain-containing protein [Chromatiales bacterium]